ncbi:MAG: malto-oligosyltrehalose trehalohydrolase, partial [Ilumatobacter sp.]|uniref:malto-oligosyltrehalose trehalohydrolase n=1 Tax=Ilumatobacter sp. TaxID=1967498 RepID=UPI0032993DC3
APDADRVHVVVERSDGDPLTVELTPTEPTDGPTSSDATWSATVDGVGAGDRYRFRLDEGDLLADPASRLQPAGVHGPSEVVDVTTFPWTDAGWAGVPLDATVLYELHVGTFTPDGTFDAAIGQLDRLVDLGVTTIEVMPVNAFPGHRNWGYDGVFAYATQASYGGPLGFARFVDAAHAKGLGVFLDVVYNHFGPEGNVLPRFGPYLTDDYSTPWGGAVNVSGRHSDSVRRYLIANAVGWVTDLHLDGLRLDAVHAIVDPTARPFVAELTAAVHHAAAEAQRDVLVTIESSSNDARIVTDVGSGGWGCDAVWSDDVHHALRVALTGERHEYYAGYSGVDDLAEAWRHRWVYRGQHSTGFGRRHGSDADHVDHRRFIAFSQNHDHNGNTPLGNRLLHDGGPGDPRLRLAAAATLLAPFTPMLFMGEEYAEPAPFPYFVDHGDPDLVRAVQEGRRREFSGVDWEGGVADPAAESTYREAVLDPSIVERSDEHRHVLDLYRELLRIRREHPVLTDADAEQDVTVDGFVMTVRRRSNGTESILILNFGDEDAGLESSDVEVHATVLDTSGATHGALAPWSARLRVAR